MYLSRFGVKNYKCLGEIDIPLTPIHVLISQNDCGKTSLLEAMAAFLSSRADELDKMFPQPWTDDELVRHGAPRVPILGRSIELAGEWGEFPAGVPFSRLKYSLSVIFNKKSKPAIKNQWMVVDDQTLPFGPEPLPTDGPLTDDYKSLLPAARGMLQTTMRGGAHKYALQPRLMAVPAAIDPIRKFRLDPDGFGLATLLDDILGYDPSVFLRIQEVFCRLFPQFRGIHLESEKAVQRQYTRQGLSRSLMTVGKGIHFESQHGEAIRAQHASDGAILLLGFLALANLPIQPNLLLIEEPENGVYPTRLGQVLELLKRLVDRTERVTFPQIILTTHSPYVLSFFQPEDVTLLSRPSDVPDTPVRARPLRDAPNIRERLAGGEFYLGELWYNLSEGELFGDAT